MSDRSRDPSEGRGVMPQDESEVEGHAVVKFRASEAPAPSDEPEVEGHGIRRPSIVPDDTQGSEDEPQVEGHGIRRP